ncbi:MAG: OadG family protein [Bacteroidaceae bacterium]|nr:OadG family protein [Bacteroidaceae bacterium]
MITNDIYGALQLLVVGMVTVFLVLLIVIYLGKLLIWAVNKWAPEETVAKKVAPAAKAIDTIDANTKAVIDAAISQITGGKGRVAKIEKLKN